jgi:uncharacterized protein (TIGR02569 family)
VLPDSVRAAFGLHGPARPLDGGQGTSVEVDGLVLKPDVDAETASWSADLWQRVEQRGFRLAAPVTARDGRLVVDGWTAMQRVDGHPVDDDDRSTAPWLRVLSAGRAFHRAVAREPRPTFLDRRDDRWAIADRVAWQELTPRPGPRSAEMVTAYRNLVVDEELSSQLVHGDLSGNVLLCEGEVPTVIDVSPYWRPSAYADAVVVVDACLWWRTDPGLLRQGRPQGASVRTWGSLLARAAIFRLLSFDEPTRLVADIEVELPRYADLLQRLRAGSPAAM